MMIRYTFVGNLIGISLRTKQLMSIELSSFFWKTIVGDKITVEDVEAEMCIRDSCYNIQRAYRHRTSLL